MARLRLRDGAANMPAVSLYALQKLIRNGVGLMTFAHGLAA
jgi:hypothetical protein